MVTCERAEQAETSPKTGGATEKGEYRSHARMTMIEPNSWGLNEVKDQSSPFFLIKSFYQKIGIQTPENGVYIER